MANPITKSITFKRGDTFSVTCQRLTAAATAFSLVGYSLAARVRNGKFSQDLTISITDAGQGRFTLSQTASQTALWPISDSDASELLCDIQFTSASVESTETFKIIVHEDITP
jgi:hypothetical protein